jgi:hypothetical protein
MGIDVGYTHLFVPYEAKLDQTGTGTTLAGE